MRAARIHDYGDVSTIRIEETPVPSLGDGEVLIEVAGYSFNPGEANLRAGSLREIFNLEFPYTLGHDVAGTLVDIGRNVTSLHTGQHVIGRLDGGGAAAEFAAAPAEVLAAAPETVPLADAAAIPIAGLTAWQAVFEHAQVSAGQDVLINGAGGGVGLFATQLAKVADARVAATASPRSRDRVRELGADQIIDYTTSPVAAAPIAPVDVLLNLIPLDPEAIDGLVQVVRPGGIIVSITEEVPVSAGSQIRSMRMNARNEVSHLESLVDLVDDGRLVVTPTERLPLSDLPEIHARSERGQISGKVVFIP